MHKCPTCGNKRKIDVAQALKLRQAKFTFEEIGKIFGVSRQAVHNALKEEL